jgi:hypothetical protein
MFQTKLAQKIKTFYIQLYLKKKTAIYEIMWKNAVEQDSPQMAI